MCIGVQSRFCEPSLDRVAALTKTMVRKGRKFSKFRHCEERSDEAIQSRSDTPGCPIQEYPVPL
jgi:hypothetical protein